jgi:hypothetical protein
MFRVRTFGAAALEAAGLASFFASLTGPDGPAGRQVSSGYRRKPKKEAQKSECTCLHVWTFARRYTFWLCEVTFLNTRLKGLVKHNIELGISRGC